METERAFLVGPSEDDLRALLDYMGMESDDRSVGRLATWAQASVFGDEALSGRQWRYLQDVAAMAAHGLREGYGDGFFFTGKELDRSRAAVDGATDGWPVCGLTRSQVEGIVGAAGMAADGALVRETAALIDRDMLSGYLTEFGQGLERAATEVGKLTEKERESRHDDNAFDSPFWPASCDWALLDGRGRLVGMVDVDTRTVGEGEGVYAPGDPYDLTEYALRGSAWRYADLGDGAYLRDQAATTTEVDVMGADSVAFLDELAGQVDGVARAVRVNRAWDSDFDDHVPKALVACWSQMSSDPDIAMEPVGGRFFHLGSAPAASEVMEQAGRSAGRNPSVFDGRIRANAMHA